MSPRAVTIRVALRGHPGVSRGAPQVTQARFRMPELGWGEHVQLEQDGLMWVAVFAFRPSTALGRIFAREYRKGQAEVRHTNPPPFDGAAVQAHFWVTPAERRVPAIARALRRLRKSA